MPEQDSAGPFARGRNLKWLAGLACFIGWGFPPLLATPDQAVSVREKFLGSNAESYAVIRTERDNLGSYFNEHCRVWLDEYSKNDGLAAEARSTLLLDQNRAIDPDDSKRKIITENSRDDTPSLADVVQRYPDMDLTPWTAEQMAELHFDAKTGRANYKSQSLVEAGAFLEKRFGDSPSAGDLELIAAAEDASNLFLTISTPRDEGSQVRVICIPSTVTRNVRALRKLQAVYLSAGIFESGEAALEHARKLGENKDFQASDLMVWSVSHADTGRTEYAVVLSDSTERIRLNAVAGMQDDSAPRLTPITSEGFRELLVKDPR